MEKDAIEKIDAEAMERLLEARRDTAEELILRLAWQQGLSRDEIQRLTWADVSLEETGHLHLPDRSIPLEPACRECLERRQARLAHVSPYVVISDRRCRPMPPESISRLARNALNDGGLTAVTLGDLRRDFIIRQLEDHDWPYAARVSGISVSTLHAQFAQYRPEEKRTEPAEKRTATPHPDEFLLWKVLQAEGASPVGLALWMSWKLGMQVREITALTWDQVDLDRELIHLADRDVSTGATLHRLLRTVWERRQNTAELHVLLTPRSGRPIDQPRLSKIVRTALIRGGLENVTLGDLCREEKHTDEDTRLLAYAMEKGTISRSEAMELLGLSKVAAYERLRRMTRLGELVRVGGKYYPAGQVVPPEEHYDVIRSYLEENGAAYRQDLAGLLRIGPRQCSLILKHMVRTGQLVQSGQQYHLPQEEVCKTM